jgi:hypothetical protein
LKANWFLACQRTGNAACGVDLYLDQPRSFLTKGNTALAGRSRHVSDFF